jgi:hypothetical protein
LTMCCLQARSLDLRNCEFPDALVCKLLEVSDYITFDPLFAECIRQFNSATLSCETFYVLKSKLSKFVLRDQRNYNQVMDILRRSFALEHEVFMSDYRFASVGYGALLSLLGTSTQYPIRLLFRWNRCRNKDFIEINDVRTRLTAPVHDGSPYATISPQEAVYTLTS